MHVPGAGDGMERPLPAASARGAARSPITPPLARLARRLRGGRAPLGQHLTHAHGPGRFDLLVDRQHGLGLGDRLGALAEQIERQADAIERVGFAAQIANFARDDKSLLVELDRGAQIVDLDRHFGPDIDAVLGGLLLQHLEPAPVLLPQRLEPVTLATNG